MAIPTGVKVGVIAVALAGAGFMFWKNTKAVDENDMLLTTSKQFFSCTKGHEFSLTAAQARKSASENNGIVLCPECSSAASEGIPCPNCKKLMSFVGHGLMPDICPACKKPVAPGVPSTPAPK